MTALNNFTEIWWYFFNKKLELVGWEMLWHLNVRSWWLKFVCVRCSGTIKILRRFSEIRIDAWLSTWNINIYVFNFPWLFMQKLRRLSIVPAQIKGERHSLRANPTRQLSSEINHLAFVSCFFPALLTEQDTDQIYIRLLRDTWTFFPHRKTCKIW